MEVGSCGGEQEALMARCSGCTHKKTYVPICHYCKEEGHVRRNCHKRASIQEERADADCYRATVAVGVEEVLPF